MSQAQAAPQQASRPFRLRCSHVWQGEVMDDALLGDEETVTLGEGGGCTFTVPRLGLPPNFTILRPGARGYVLTLGRGMGGRIKIGGEEQDVREFLSRGGGGAEGAEGNYRATNVAPGDWGVIHLDDSGDHVFFFQFLPEDPKLPPPVWVLGLLVPALAFSIMLHAIFVTTTYLLADEGNPFMFPGSRELMTAYLVKRPEPEEPPKKEKKADKAAGREDIKKKVKKPAATKGKKGKAGGQGEKRSAAPDPAKGEPDKPVPKVAFLEDKNRKTLDQVAKMGGMDKDFGKTLARLKRDQRISGDSGRGHGTGTGVGDYKDGTGTTRGAKKGGSGGGGHAHEDVVTQKDMDTGGERAGHGNGGRKPHEVKLQRGTASGDFSGLSKEEVDKVVKSRAGSIRACYQNAVNRQPGLSGTLTVRFTIKDRGGKGVVTRAQVVRGKSSLHNSSVENCVLRKIQSLTFPAKGGAFVTYPFIFTQG